MRLIVLVMISLMCAFDSSATGDDRRIGNVGYPPKMRPIFEDDFSVDSRDQYSSKGKLDWEQGQLTLRPGAFLERPVAGGTRARFKLEIEGFSRTFDPTAEVRLWIDLDGAGSCVLRLQPGEGATSADQPQLDFTRQKKLTDRG